MKKILLKLAQAKLLQVLLRRISNKFNHFNINSLLDDIDILKNAI